MTYTEAHRAVLAGEHPATVAERYGISERTAYRYKAGGRPGSAIDYVRILALVMRHKGDANAIRAAVKAIGYNRFQCAHARMVMLRDGTIDLWDWPPTRATVDQRHWKLLRAMVEAGATPRHVARCFDVNEHAAGRAIREAWVLIELERRQA